MSKIGLIIEREYFTRVKKKSFLITTILVPVLMLAFYAIILMIAFQGSSGSQGIAIIDEAGLFNDSVPIKKGDIRFDLIKDQSKDQYIGKYKDAGYDALLYIPKIDIYKPEGISIHSKSNTSITTTMAIDDLVTDAIVLKRLDEQGIEREQFKSISAGVKITSTIDTEEGSKKAVAGVAYAVSMACGILIYMMMIIYGTQVMRGVTEEKTNRIAEVVVSSVKPFQLMMGKIIGIGAVGLTQFAIWIILLLLAQMAVPLIFPDLFSQAGSAAGSAEVQSSIMTEISAGLSSLPLAKIGLLFVFYFLAGYLTYASMFAAVGSVVSEDQQEAQQLMFPILMPIIIGFVIMMQAVNEPHSGLAVFGSLFPLTSPIVMMGRATYEIPIWQILVSMVLLVGCFFFFIWITAKIYRVGILMYGKKPSWKEMLKWGFRKS